MFKHTLRRQRIKLSSLESSPDVLGWNLPSNYCLNHEPLVVFVLKPAYSWMYVIFPSVRRVVTLKPLSEIVKCHLASVTSTRQLRMRGV